MLNIYILTDYNNYFGSKSNAVPYKSGMDITILSKLFLKNGYEPEFIPFSEVIEKGIAFWTNKIVLYTSSEDTGLFYKSYIEDIIYALKLYGAILIPDYKFLKAHHNKVFMEILKLQLLASHIKTNYTYNFGTLEESLKKRNEITYPVVYKQASSAMSKGVGLIKKLEEFKKIVKSFSRTSKPFIQEFKDLGREFKYKGYKKESFYRGKFILQEFIPNLENDWKVLVFNEKYFVVRREVRPKDFRASGGGINTFGEESNTPKGVFDFAKKVYELLEIPMLSLDVCFDGNDYYALEFQVLYFGTSGIAKSKEYYQLNNGCWETIINRFEEEDLYVYAIVSYLNNHNNFKT
jgi:glutathione synthase/RimK-type ligase-like ATP-grasp enzyme